MDIDNAEIPVPCPTCGYLMNLRLQQVRLEEHVTCPCCKNYVRLVDKGASVSAGKQSIDNSIKGLKKAMKDLNKTLKFKI